MNALLLLKKINSLTKQISKQFLIMSGLVFFPVILIFLYILVNEYVLGEYESLTFTGHLGLWSITLIISGCIGIKNLYDYLYKGKRNFSSIKDYFREEKYSPERAKGMYPEIPEKLLFQKPVGIVLGKIGFSFLKRYVCINPHDKQIANHVAICGNSAAGKSSGPILTSIIPNFMQENQDVAPSVTYLVVDTKPEIAELSTSSEQWSRILNPKDRNSYGWDLYWNLSSESTEDDIYEVMKSCADVLISDTNEQNAFFVHNARNILCAVLMFEFIRNKRNFIESIRELLRANLTEYIKLIKSVTNDRHRIYMLLAEFGKEDKSNALQDILKTIKEGLEVFTREDVAWFLDTRINPKICSPWDLENGVSLFLSIKRADLKQYNVLFRLIISQSIEHLSRRDDDDPNARPVVFVLDEFPNLGARIPNYCENLGFIRSKKVTFITIFQQYSQIEALYGKEQAKTILNMGHQLVLSCEDTELGKIFSDKAGRFWQEKTDHKRTGTFIKRRIDGEHVSMVEERRIRVMDDLASLGPRFESIAFINGAEYYRFDKCRYYLEPKLRERAEECKRINQAKRYGYKQEEE